MASSDGVSQSNRIDLQGPIIREDVGFGQDATDSLNAISKPVEMTDLSSKRGDLQKTSLKEKETQQTPATSSAMNKDGNEISSAQIPNTTSIVRLSEDESAIGPATERSLVNVRSSPMSGPHLVITLLLHSTDTRHPYILNEKYLKRRNVQVADNDPVNLTVYNLKDLIWRDWREDWETRPASPTSIRLIHMGRMLDDKTYLKDSRFAAGDAPHVVHMSVKPQEAIDEEDAKMAKGSTRDRDDSERTSRCRCTIM